MSKQKEPIKILVSVELGSPAADCAHFGICSVDIITPQQWATFQPQHIRQLKAVVSATPDGRLKFTFPFDGMRADTRMEFFPLDGFRIDSTKTLSCTITEALGLPSGVRTLPHMYPLELLNNGLEIVVTLVAAEQSLAMAA